MKRMTPLVALALAGCMSMEPPYVRPDPAIPASWPAGDAYLRQSEATLPTVTYRDIFRDPRLQSLIGQALVNNRDLMIAAANIAAARAQYHIQRAASLPQVNANAGATRTTTAGASGANTSYTAGVGVPGFELDLFGRVASLSHAQLQRFLATEAGARATRLTLVANIADAWLLYASDASLLKIAGDTAASAERSVQLTSARLQGGIAPRTDLTQAQQVLETARADLADQRTALAQDVNLLQLLTGAPVDTRLLPQSIDEAAATIAELPPGLDSHVLLRRPDVVQAEYQLRAANAEIGAARAALFPSISLTGLLGLASNALAGLFSGGVFTWSASAGASYPIFSGGAGKANVQLTRAQRDAAIATYQQAIQVAFREVSDALARRGTMDDQLRAREANLAAASDTYRLSDARYRAGIDPFLSNLIAQRSFYAAQQSLVLSRLESATNRVSLYQTLGGDSLQPSGPPSKLSDL
ncbi:MAG: transporter [Sphingomonas bacterium]|uniref:efflux transporter outer membrane subunit n=1 Tax=Sphingomonas bacterium TaxID=1895847 RepID=UPI00260CFF68|nr:efflux transporter outer membrane subunit [Sphingomonas bacterium]MDB5702922.1 transporter [Sphingomonas bacterium]